MDKTIQTDGKWTRFQECISMHEPEPSQMSAKLFKKLKPVYQQKGSWVFIICIEPFHLKRHWMKLEDQSKLYAQLQFTTVISTAHFGLQITWFLELLHSKVQIGLVEVQHTCFLESWQLYGVSWNSLNKL